MLIISHAVSASFFDENRIDKGREIESEREKTACFAFDFINVRLNDFVQFK